MAVEVFFLVGKQRPGNLEMQCQVIDFVKGKRSRMDRPPLQARALKGALEPERLENTVTFICCSAPI